MSAPGRRRPGRLSQGEAMLRRAAGGGSFFEGSHIVLDILLKCMREGPPNWLPHLWGMHGAWDRLTCNIHMGGVLSKGSLEKSEMPQWWPFPAEDSLCDV